MTPITFSVLGAAACAFLTYVLVQFKRVVLNARRTSGSEPGLTAANSLSNESAWVLATTSGPGTGGQQAKNEAAQRKEILTCAIFGVVGLLAPFFFAMLFARLWSR